MVERHLKRICIVQNVDSLYCLRRRNILSEVKVGIPPTNKLVGILPTNFMNPYLMSVVSEWWYGVKEEEREELNTKSRKGKQNE